MANGVWKGFYPLVFGHSKQLLLNKFFDPSTPSMRKGRDGGRKKTGKIKGEKTDDYSGHYVIASSRPPEPRQLERRTLVPIISTNYSIPTFTAQKPECQRSLQNKASNFLFWGYALKFFVKAYTLPLHWGHLRHYCLTQQ